MKVKIDFTADYPDIHLNGYLDGSEPMLSIDWDLPFLPRIGEGFDWIRFLPKKELEKMLTHEQFEKLVDVSGMAGIYFVDWSAAPDGEAYVRLVISDLDEISKE